MTKYNLEYEANGKKTELKKISREELQEFLNKLKKEKESSLRVKKVDEEDRER